MDTGRKKRALDSVDTHQNNYAYGSHFVTGKVFALLLMKRGSVLDCCIILGKPDNRENRVDTVPTLFAFTRPVNQA